MQHTYSSCGKPVRLLTIIGNIEQLAILWISMWFSILKATIWRASALFVNIEV